MRTDTALAALVAASLLAAPTATAQSVPTERLSPLPGPDGAKVPEVDERPLGAPGPGGVGLLPPQVTGLPADIWQGSNADVLAELITGLDPAVPALRALLVTLLLAEAEPPAAGDLTLLVARLDRLQTQGAVEEALALVERAGHTAPPLFIRWAELSLLLGRPAGPCQEIAAQPTLTEDLGLRIYCLARAGEWQRAAFSYRTAAAMGALGQRDAALFELFLDPEAEPEATLRPPVRPTPLEVRLFEAIGEPLPTDPLPLPFAVQDLDGDNGWRAQLLAAERLARAGSLPANRLLGLYSLREAAASGGVWDRVDALQSFEAALDSGRTGPVTEALRAVWPQMASAGLLVPFAELFAPELTRLPLEGRAGEMALRAAALSPEYETLLRRMPEGPEAAFLRRIAGGEAPDTAELPGLPHDAEVARGFSGAEPPEQLSAMRAAGRLGEVILRSVALFSDGAAGNGDDLTDALATMRAVGLEDLARRAALQLMILDAERARR